MRDGKLVTYIFLSTKIGKESHFEKRKKKKEKIED